MELKGGGTARNFGGLPDRVAKTLAALGINHDDGFAAKDRLRNEAREHDALPRLRGSDDERAATKA